MVIWLELCTSYNSSCDQVATSIISWCSNIPDVLRSGKGLPSLSRKLAVKTSVLLCCCQHFALGVGKTKLALVSFWHAIKHEYRTASHTDPINHKSVDKYVI